MKRTNNSLPLETIAEIYRLWDDKPFLARTIAKKLNISNGVVNKYLKESGRK